MVDFLCLPSYLCYEFYNVCNNYKMEKLGNVFQGEVSLLIGKKMPWWSNTFLMDLWLRLGPWLLYRRKCDMGILFCLSMLRGGFQLLRRMNFDDEIYF